MSSLFALVLIIYSFARLNAEDVYLDLYVLVDPTVTNWAKDIYGDLNYYQEILNGVNNMIDTASPQFVSYI